MLLRSQFFSQKLVFQKQPFADVLKIDTLKNFVQYLQENTCVEVLVAVLQAWNVINKRPQHRSFSVNIVKFLETVFLLSIYEQLLLLLLKTTMYLESVCKFVYKSIEPNELITP